MQTHEVVHITIDDEEHKIKRQPDQTKSDSKQQETRQAQPDDPILRGWDGLKAVTTLRGHGIGHKKAWFWFLFGVSALFLLPVDPDSRHLVFSNETANFWAKVIVAIITMSLMVGVYFSKPRIIITKTGFYWCIFHRKLFVPWEGCSEFKVNTIIEEKGVLMKDKTRETISFQHRSHLTHTTPISLANVSAKALCETMNKYRNAYQKAKNKKQT